MACHSTDQTLVHFISYLFGSDPANSLKRTKEHIQTHMRLFERAAKFSVRQQKVMQNIEQELAKAPLTRLSKDVYDKNEDKVEFPVSTVTMFKNFSFLGRNDELRAVILLDWRGVDLRPNPRHPPKRRFAARIATALQCRYILYIVSLGMGLVL